MSIVIVEFWCWSFLHLRSDFDQWWGFSVDGLERRLYLALVASPHSKMYVKIDVNCQGGSRAGSLS